MSKRILIIFLLTSCRSVMAQTPALDSLKAAYQKNRQDTTLVNFLLEKSLYYRGLNPDSGMKSLRHSLSLSRKIHYKRGETQSIDMISLYEFDRGNLAESMKLAFELLPKAEAINDEEGVWGSYILLGLDYYTLQDYKKSFDYMYLSAKVANKYRLYGLSAISYHNLAYCYILLGKVDSAEYNNRQLTRLRKYTGEEYILSNESAIALWKGEYDTAIRDARKSIRILAGIKDYLMLATNYLVIAKAHQRSSQPDSSLVFAKTALDYANKEKSPDGIISAAGLLSDLYKARNDYKRAFDYQQIMLRAKDTLYNQRKALQVQSVTAEEAERKRQAEAAKEAYQKNAEMFALLGALGVFVVIALILLYNNRQRRKANILLTEQKMEVQNALTRLKSTQNQLIQAEKMASLGELTAGIAHEIQNPLNFVNNFSEVNAELIDEMQQEIDKGDLQEVKAVALNVQENEKKINMHGKRADAIVKGMLQHSQSGSGTKEPTNINALADEYMRLSYHGLRSKDKTFNAEMITHFDKNLPKINVIPQDIGRVMLNLFNNAFYAVNQRQKVAGEDYKPEVSVTTSTENGQVVIKVKDNGTGIPDAIKDKIMQPFFTTKPTGEGTGLGLSLTYDMVVKGHGGSITVDTKEGEYTIFTINLPLT